MKLKSKKERRKQLFALQGLANCRVRHFDAQQGLEPKEFAPQGLSLTSKKAFSIAEAMIVFTIVSVAIASVAPMISKQVKYNEMADLQAKVLNQRIEEVKKSAWKLTPNKKSITRPTDSVGIGVPEGSNPIAKLDVRNWTPSLLGFRLSVPENVTSSPFLVIRGVGELFRLAADGSIYAKHFATVHDEALNIVNADGKSLIRVTKEGGLYLNEQGESPQWRIGLSSEGIFTLNGPPKNSKGQFTRAISIYYPQDWTPDIDCCSADGKSLTGNGYTETAFFNSNGSLYINSIVGRDADGFAYPALEIRNGVTQRASINTDGQLVLRPSDNAFDELALLISKGTGGNTVWINRDGSAWFKGNVSVDGTIANAELDTKLAKINNELIEAKEVIAELKLENEGMKAENKELKEKLASFESQLVEIMAINNLQKIAQKK